MVARDGWSQFSGREVILTGDTGGCPSRELSETGTCGSAFSWMLCGEELEGLESGLRLVGLVVIEPWRGGEESTAAIAKGSWLLSPMGSTSDQLPERQWSQSISKKRVQVVAVVVGVVVGVVVVIVGRSAR